MIAIMSDEYAKCYSETSGLLKKCGRALVNFKPLFQKKHKIKNKLKFGKLNGQP
jgi:hypothetical protein